MTMKAVKIRHDLKTVLKAISERVGESVQFRGFSSDGGLNVGSRNAKLSYTFMKGEVVEILGGFYEKDKQVYAKWIGKKNPVLEIKKKILTFEEFKEVMKSHNKGFGCNYNKKKLEGVVVFIPSLSGWGRRSWNCSEKYRSYKTDSSAEVFREAQCNETMLRHLLFHLVSLTNCDNYLVRKPDEWVVDYCYITGFKN